MKPLTISINPSLLIFLFCGFLLIKILPYLIRKDEKGLYTKRGSFECFSLIIILIVILIILFIGGLTFFTGGVS